MNLNAVLLHQLLLSTFTQQPLLMWSYSYTTKHSSTLHWHTDQQDRGRHPQLPIPAAWWKSDSRISLFISCGETANQTQQHEHQQHHRMKSNAAFFFLKQDFFFVMWEHDISAVKFDRVEQTIPNAPACNHDWTRCFCATDNQIFGTFLHVKAEFRPMKISWPWKQL